MSDQYTQEQNAIFDKYPGARAFADLIVGESEEEVEEMARLVDSRVRALAPEPAPTPAPAAEPEPGGLLDRMDRSPRGPAPVVSGPTSSSERVEKAIQKGSFGDFLTAKWEGQFEEVAHA